MIDIQEWCNEYHGLSNEIEDCVIRVFHTVSVLRDIFRNHQKQIKDNGVDSIQFERMMMVFFYLLGRLEQHTETVKLVQVLCDDAVRVLRSGEWVFPFPEIETPEQVLDGISILRREANRLVKLHHDALSLFVGEDQSISSLRSAADAVRDIASLSLELHGLYEDTVELK